MNEVKLQMRIKHKLVFQPALYFKVIFHILYITFQDSISDKIFCKKNNYRKHMSFNKQSKMNLEPKTLNF